MGDMKHEKEETKSYSGNSKKKTAVQTVFTS
uniref:Uncharacterized protein n=1 Tax=Rhizophora mucronata TaxID=61149 RepID=A0A2P2P9I5_RHIMU